MPVYFPDPFAAAGLVQSTALSTFAAACRVLQLGGVYADMDVQCLKPIDDWNAEHGHDAQVLLGMENYANDREHPIHVTNWVLASVPGHPLLGNMPSIVSKSTQHQFFEVMRHKGSLTPGQTYEAGIIDRTGPAALSWAMYDYFSKIGQNLSAVNESTVSSADGFIAGGVRVLPTQNMGSGWEVAEARLKGVNFTCNDVAEKTPDAYVCHMFFGSWRTQWQFKVDGTDTC